jgi:ABC-type antimicrobial peptide transport system permease subunit
MGLVVTESLVLGALGGAVGIVGGQAILRLLAVLPLSRDRLGALDLAALSVKPEVAVTGFVVALAIGLAAGAGPALGAGRARVVDALRTS